MFKVRLARGNAHNHRLPPVNSTDENRLILFKRINERAHFGDVAFGVAFKKKV